MMPISCTALSMGSSPNSTEKLTKFNWEAHLSRHILPVHNLLAVPLICKASVVQDTFTIILYVISNYIYNTILHFPIDIPAYTDH